VKSQCPWAWDETAGSLFLCLVFVIVSSGATPLARGLLLRRWRCDTMNDGLSSVSHAVFQNAHHFEWCTKYRYKIFNSFELINACEASIRHAAERHGIKIFELSVMPDHIHCVVEFRPSLSVSTAEGLLKGASAHELFALFPPLRKQYWGGHLWSSGRFSRSLGNIDIKRARDYVRFENDSRQQTLAAY